MTHIRFLLLAFVSLICLNGCQSETEGLKKYSKKVFRDVVKKDTAALKAHFYRPSEKESARKIFSFNAKCKIDSQDKEEADTCEDPRKIEDVFRNYGVVSNFYQYEDFINTFYFLSKEKSLDSAQYIKTVIDTISSKNYKGKKIDLMVYFNCDGQKHRMNLNGIIKLKDEYNFYSITNPVSETNLFESEKLEWKNDHFRDNLRVTKFSFDGNDGLFERFAVTISNETGYDLETVEFRLTIKKYVGAFEEKVYSDTYTLTDVRDGDIVRKKIEDLINFSGGFHIGDMSEWNVDGRITDVDPFPVDTPSLKNDKPFSNL